MRPTDEEILGIRPLIGEMVEMQNEPKIHSGKSLEDGKGF